MPHRSIDLSDPMRPQHTLLLLSSDVHVVLYAGYVLFIRSDCFDQSPLAPLVFLPVCYYLTGQDRIFLSLVCGGGRILRLDIPVQLLHQCVLHMTAIKVWNRPQYCPMRPLFTKAVLWCFVMQCGGTEGWPAKGIHWAVGRPGPASAGSRMMYESPYATVRKDPIDHKKKFPPKRCHQQKWVAISSSSSSFLSLLSSRDSFIRAPGKHMKHTWK